jgi:hypothetical protein
MPIFAILLFIGAIGMVYNYITHLFVINPDKMPEYIHVEQLGPIQIVQGHGRILHVVVHNSSTILKMEGDSDDSPPLWLACQLSGPKGHRIVGLPMDWTLNDDFDPSFAKIPANTTMTIGFKTELGFEWYNQPIQNETFDKCVIGSSKYQAMMQFGVEPPGNSYF